jgi:outer membrane lipoprotein SlyB
VLRLQQFAPDLELHMKVRTLVHASMAGALMALTVGAQLAHAQTRVQYGRITAVSPVTETSSTSQNVGMLVGGGLGLASGGGQSTSNRVLRTAAGGTAGRAVGGRMNQTQAFEYTVLVGGTNTVRIVSDQAGKRVGDCVSIEQGQFANIRLVPDARCNPAPAPRPAAPAAAPAPPPPPVAEDVAAATACEQAKQQVLDAATDEAFNLAERRMRLLCGE